MKFFFFCIALNVPYFDKHVSKFFKKWFCNATTTLTLTYVKSLRWQFNYEREEITFFYFRHVFVEVVTGPQNNPYLFVLIGCLKTCQFFAILLKGSPVSSGCYRCKKKKKQDKTGFWTVAWWYQIVGFRWF